MWHVAIRGARKRAKTREIPEDSSSLSLFGFGDLYALLVYIRTNERDFTVSSHNVLIRQRDTCLYKHKHVSACVCVFVWLCCFWPVLVTVW